MSVLIKTLKPGQLSQICKALGIIQGRQASHWYPDYKPEPVPQTQEDRIRAAKKYNLLPEEYDTFEDGEGHGDYPKLEFESVDSRDPWYAWDNPELRKSFGDPINIRMVNGLPEMYSTQGGVDSSRKEMLYFIALCAGGIFFVYLLSFIKLLHPVTEKQLVTPGVTHYTFDLDDNKKHH